MSKLNNLRMALPGTEISFSCRGVECSGKLKEVEMLHCDDAVIYVSECIYDGARQPGVQEFSFGELSSMRIEGGGALSDASAQPKKVQEGAARKETPMVLGHRRLVSDNPHLAKLKKLRIPELTSQQQLDDPLPWKVLDEPGAPKMLPPPEQDADGDKPNDQLSPEWKGIRERCWLDVNTLPKLYLPHKHYLVETEDIFHFCVGDLEKQDLVGVSLEGQYLSRFGLISLLCITTNDAVHVFDVVKLGQELCFEGKPRGSCNLKTVLENRNVLKVFHDCRKPSDILFRRHGVRLSNVADTMVCHALFSCQAVLGGFLPKYAITTAHMARAYLGISTKDLYFPHYRLSHLNEDSKIWMDRPLPLVLEINAVRNAAYLLQIHSHVKRALNSFHRDAVDLMLADMRDDPDAEVVVKMHEEQVLPPSLERVLPDFVPDEEFARSYIGQTEGRFVHQSVGQMDPNVIFSRDVMHQKRE